MLSLDLTLSNKYLLSLLCVCAGMTLRIWGPNGDQNRGGLGLHGPYTVVDIENNNYKHMVMNTE